MANKAPFQVHLGYTKTIVFLLCSLPAVLLVYNAFTGGLGANPVEEITHETGQWGLRFLLLSLAVTPLRRLSGWNWLIRLRRMIGLFAFSYVVLHLTTYVWLDAYFDLAYILEDIVERLYITAGFIAFLAMVPLALTSTDAMVRRLGGRAWRRLHKLAYASAIGGALHFIWLVKADLREPLIYAAILTLLLLARIPVVAKALSNLRLKPTNVAKTNHSPVPARTSNAT